MSGETRERAQRQLHALSTYLHTHRDDVLQLWREAIDRDPGFTAARGLAQRALDDLVPKILSDLESRLHAEHAFEATRAELEQRQDAAEHGLHRWQQGFDLSETMREWGHLHDAVLEYFNRYGAAHRDLDPAVLLEARDLLAALTAEGVRASAARYVRLMQDSAASRLRDLESSLNALQRLENERAALLREAAHDLRGSVAVIANASAILSHADIGAGQRDHFYDVLQRGIQEMGSLLGDLAELARLEAGEDPLKIESFDAAASIREYCDLLRPMASERGLFLNCSGPGSLVVDSDRFKTQRIVQNLVLNAVKATEKGGIKVVWSSGPGKRWKLCVQDTGPGMALGADHPLRSALKEATEKAHEIERRNTTPAPLEGEGSAAPSQPSISAGEGIGLSIVKRLCDLLGASIELETSPGHGTTIQIAFPLSYGSRGQDRT
jgi:signal transduction histidine kinase